MDNVLDDLIRRADLDELVRHVDATCSARDWEHVLRIRNQARQAVNTGRQLWPIATLANFRLALWAPAELAVQALDDTARTFMPGPVSEIMAQYHRWDDLVDFLAPGHDRSLLAYERSLRGDVIDHDEPTLLDIPCALQEWEPHYALASYSDDGIACDSPDIPNANTSISVTNAERIDDPDTVHAFRRLVEPWTAQSNGEASVAVVEGGLDDALGALGAQHPFVDSLTASEALSWLAWAGASGGAQGKRRGAATGRSEAWWLLATFTGLVDEWPCDPDEFGEVLNDLEYYVFRDDMTPTSGWNLSLAVIDPDEGLSIAMRATDSLAS